MKATGIVRRIDDLGRVVIPKEIRRTMRIREGDPLEIYTDAGGEVIFKKYSPVGELASFAEAVAESIAEATKLSFIISDRDRCVAAAGISKREVLERRNSTKLEEVMESRRVGVFDGGEKAEALEGTNVKMCVAAPILSMGDMNGAVVLAASEKSTEPNEADIKIAQVAATFLGKQMEQ